MRCLCFHAGEDRVLGRHARLWLYRLGCSHTGQLPLQQREKTLSGTVSDGSAVSHALLLEGLQQAVSFEQTLLAFKQDSFGKSMLLKEEIRRFALRQHCRQTEQQKLHPQKVPTIISNLSTVPIGNFH